MRVQDKTTRTMTLDRVGLDYACSQMVEMLREQDPNVMPWRLWPDEQRHKLLHQANTLVRAYMSYGFATAH